MTSSRLAKYYRLLHRHWNSTLSAVSVTGFLVAYQFGLSQHYRNLFLFLGANAVIWTLVEIRAALMPRETPTRFPNMRSARPLILASLKGALARRRQSEVKIIGGRIRTISDMLREIVVAIQNGEIPAHNTRFYIYCLSPEFVISEMRRADLQDAEAFEGRFTGYADLIRQFSAELEAYNHHADLQKQGIEFTVVCYRSLPWLYAFLVDGSDLFWGFFKWNPGSEDFDGPPNPCFSLSESSEAFRDLYGWLENRALIFTMTNTNAVSQPTTSNGAGQAS